MPEHRAYRILCCVVGGFFVVSGLVFAFSFFGYQRPHSQPILPTGPVGHYFAALAGCAMIGWGGALLGVARNPASGRTLGTISASVLVLMAVIRMLAWVVGDYYVWLGELTRIEAALFLLMALAFVWLRPPPLRPAVGVA